MNGFRLSRARALGLIASLATVATLTAAGTAFASGLTGETLTGTIPDASSSFCNESQTFRLEFRAGGNPLDQAIATGPFPGTFQEDGVLVVRDGVVTTLTATFTINSGDTTITGTKTLTPDSVATATCTSDPHQILFTAINLAYTATIVGPDGTTTDEGLTAVSGGSPIPNFQTPFIETFISTKPLGPEQKKDCKDKTFAGFKNQGDCVAFLSTGGKNEPGQNQPRVP